MTPHPALRVIQDEHRTLAAVLRSISLLLASLRRHDAPLDFLSLRAMLFYIDEFPEKVHHRKESEFLFPRIRQRTHASSEVIDRLEHDHEATPGTLRLLAHELLALEMLGHSRDWPARRDAFEERTRAYVQAYLEHMRIEETIVLPLAEQVLTEADWRELDAEFMKNRDPLTQRDPEDEFRPLFKRILMTLPAPLGLGPVAG